MLKGVPIILPDLLMIMEDLVKLNLPSSLLFISLNSTIALLSLKVDAEEYLLSITRLPLISIYPHLGESLRPLFKT